MTRRRLPVGTVTFLFTDIAGSTLLLQRLRGQYADVLAEHRAILRAAIEKWHGYEVDTQGDAFFVAFPKATDAVSAAVDMQRRLSAHPWPAGVQVCVRMGLHTGEARLAEEGYVGIDVHRAARIAHVGYGGQVLLSETTEALVREDLPDDLGLRDLGEYRLKDLRHPKRIYQLVIQGLPADFPQLNSLDAHPNNLPLQPTPFIGREADLASARDSLLKPDVRLLTLVGPGGIGKTRLGLQLAAELTEEFQDGAYFVALVPIADPGLVISTMAQTLGLREQGGRPFMETLTEYLQAKQMLLLLDNFEHVISAASTIGELLRTCPRVKFLVTSREPLRLRGEFEFQVQPLASPDVTCLPSLDLLSRYPAVELFSQRAQAIRPDFSVTSGQAQAVAEICARLDGLPLAIELAAARVKLLPPLAMLKRLKEADGSSVLRLLTGGARDAPERHRTLRAAIDWSYKLLDRQEQRLFRSLAVFAGGFTLSAAEAVCGLAVSKPGLEPGAVHDFEITERVSSLLDKSLLRQEEGLAGEPRFTMLEVIREYALEKQTENSEEADIRERHAKSFLALAERAKPLLQGPDQRAWLEQLESEHHNLRSALKWFLEQAEAEDLNGAEAGELALRMAGALWPFWDTHGYVSEGREWMRRALVVSDKLTEARIEALVGAAELATRQSEFPEGILLYEQALTLARELGYKAGMARALSSLGYLHSILAQQDDLVESHYTESVQLWREVGDERGIATALGPLAHRAAARYDFEEASQLFAESLTLFRKVGDQREIAGALYNLGEVSLRSGDFAKAEERFRESRAIYVDLGDTHGVATQLRCLAEVERAQGNPGHARGLYEEGLASFRAIGDKGCASIALAGLGRVVLDLGDCQSAIPMLLECLDLSRETGERRQEAHALRLLGLTDLSQGDVDAARRRFCESLQLERALDSEQGIAASLEEMAKAATTGSDYERAAKLFSASERLRDSTGIPLLPIDVADLERWKRKVCEGLGDSAFKAAQAEGNVMTIGQAIELAMEEWA